MKYTIWTLMYVGLFARLLAFGCMWRRELLAKYIFLTLFLVLGSVRTGVLLYLRHTDQRAYAAFHSASADAMFLVHLGLVLEALVMLARHHPNSAVFAAGGYAFLGIMSAALASLTANLGASGTADVRVSLAIRIYAVAFLICLGCTLLFLRQFKRIKIRANVRTHCYILYAMFVLVAAGSGLVASKSSLTITGIGMILLVCADIVTGSAWAYWMRPKGEELIQPPPLRRTLNEIEGRA
jgi:hypothetical protein